MKNVNSRAAIRKISLGLVVAAAAMGASTSAFAAVQAIPASATVVPPLTISEPADLRFGSVAPAATAGTVVLALPATLPAVAPTTAAPTTNSVRTATGGVLMVGGGTCNATTVLCGVASVQVQGIASGSFSTITLPATVALTSGANTMNVGTLTRRAGNTGAGTTTGAAAFSATGTAMVLIGGTLQVGANQAAGAYTGTMNVTIDY